jgi:hypothetical protein
MRKKILTLAATIMEHVLCRLRLYYRSDAIIIMRWHADTVEVLEAIARSALHAGPDVRWVDRRGNA